MLITGQWRCRSVVEICWRMRYRRRQFQKIPENDSDAATDNQVAASSYSYFIRAGPLRWRKLQKIEKRKPNAALDKQEAAFSYSYYTAFEPYHGRLSWCGFFAFLRKGGGCHVLICVIFAIHRNIKNTHAILVCCSYLNHIDSGWGLINLVFLACRAGMARRHDP